MKTGGRQSLTVATMRLLRARPSLVDGVLAAGLGVLTSVIMGAVVTVAALALAVNLLSSFTLKGEPA